MVTVTTLVAKANSVKGTATNVKSANVAERKPARVEKR